MPDRYVVELTDRGFVVVDDPTDEIVRGTFSQRFKAREVAAELNRESEPVSDIDRREP